MTNKVQRRDPASLKSDLLTLLADPTSVIDDLKKRTELGKDEWFASAVPEIAVEPSTSQEVASVLAYAHEHRIPVTTRGAGYGYVGGCVPVEGGILLSTVRLNQILEIHTGDFVAVTQPAVITGKLQEAVRTQGLFYPPDPASLDHCSIGGNVATNAGGPRCLKYGVTRNYVLGLEVALADGTLVRVGGRTHKNKTGFDLVSMFIGSEGLLGIITEITVRLLPLPPARATLSAGFATMSEAARAVQGIFEAGFLPSAIEVADHFTLEAARRDLKKELQILIPPGKAHLLIEIDGQQESVVSETATLKKLLESYHSLQTHDATTKESCDSMWALRRSFSMALRATGLIKLNEDIVVPRSRLCDLVSFTEQLQNESGYPIACFGHAGDGNIHVNIMISLEEQKNEKQKIEELLQQLFSQVLEWNGTITGEHGIGLAKLPWWKKATSNEVRDLHTRLKSALDPYHILNPGKFV
ncbi:MAG: FAD-binding protein [Verrucomicrobia bacterium]|nr:MAG: FAD-binding protein [Verrucomicrobiota bacterium]